ncbi:galacturonosyltransferase [Butyrivibrio sp. TB]|nr:galacturonosyltransferase [Butyrivibrio sp. TB]
MKGNVMSKVLFLANNSTGLYAFRNELLLSLKDDGYDVVVSIPDDEHRSDIEEEGIRVIHTDLDRRGMNPLKDFKLIKKYKKLLKSEKPDIVLTYTIKPNIYGGYVCGRLGIPFISTITGLGSAFEKGGIVQKLVTVMYRTSMKKCSCLFFQNAENKALFEKLGITGKRTALVGGSGVNLDYHKKADVNDHGDVIRFLYVGRLMKEKGIEEYLYAAQKMRKEYGDRVLFSTLGYDDDSYTQRMKTAQEDGIVTVIPFHKDVRPFYAECDVLVQPSYHEGMSNVIMEAAAAGRPVLCSNISGCKELVDDGVTGFVFKPGDGQALYEAMNRFIILSKEERLRLGDAGRIKMEKEYDRHIIVRAYAGEIKNILKNRT